MPRVVNKGVSIHYSVEGNGPPLILQHGFSDSSETWSERGFVAALKPKYRLVLIDARGHGQSDKPHDPAILYAGEFRIRHRLRPRRSRHKDGCLLGVFNGRMGGIYPGTTRAGSSCMFRDRRCVGQYRKGLSDRTWKRRFPDCDTPWRTRRSHQSLGRVGDTSGARACTGKRYGRLDCLPTAAAGDRGVFRRGGHNRCADASLCRKC